MCILFGGSTPVGRYILPHPRAKPLTNLCNTSLRCLLFPGCLATPTLPAHNPLIIQFAHPGSVTSNMMTMRATRNADTSTGQVPTITTRFIGQSAIGIHIFPLTHRVLVFPLCVEKLLATTQEPLAGDTEQELFKQANANLRILYKSGPKPLPSRVYWSVVPGNEPPEWTQDGSPFSQAPDKERMSPAV